MISLIDNVQAPRHPYLILLMTTGDASRMLRAIESKAAVKQASKQASKQARKQASADIVNSQNIPPMRTLTDYGVKPQQLKHLSC